MDLILFTILAVIICYIGNKGENMIYPLKLYIEKFHSGNQTHFAKAAGITHRQQVGIMLQAKGEFLVIDHEGKRLLVQVKRGIK